jgi:hypothetical protein
MIHRNRIHSNKCFPISDMLYESSGSGEKAECSDNSLDVLSEYSGPYEETAPDVEVEIEG